jgi:hypothetical protein
MRTKEIVKLPCQATLMGDRMNNFISFENVRRRGEQSSNIKFIGFVESIGFFWSFWFIWVISYI